MYEKAVAEAKSGLSITDEEFWQPPTEQSESVIYQIENRFVDGHHWSWWWEHLYQIDFAAVHVEDTGFLWLNQILPEPTASVWFIVEPCGEKKCFSVYDARAKHIQSILEASICFEYYIVAKDLTWLFGENHHGCCFCVGEPVTARFQDIVEQHPEQWSKTANDD